VAKAMAARVCFSRIDVSPELIRPQASAK